MEILSEFNGKPKSEYINVKLIKSTHQGVRCFEVHLNYLILFRFKYIEDADYLFDQVTKLFEGAVRVTKKRRKR